jgi:hypothetical protein
VKRRPLRPLLFPALILLVGILTGQLAEYAVGYRQAYGFYGLARPVSDLTLLIGAIWLAIAVARVLLQRLRPR